LSNLLPERNAIGLDYRTPYILGSDCLEPFIAWIEETTLLFGHGMPTNAYRLVIDGSSREAVHAFELIKYAAALQEAMLEQARRNGVQPVHWLLDPRRYSYFDVPWHLPAGFPDTIRKIMDGTSNISFTGPVGDPWDSDAMFAERKDWEEDDWRKEWKQKICIGGSPDGTFY
jgi:hypothetical protein